jgi:type III secretory pathway component EscR
MVEQNISLKPFNSFGIDVKADYFSSFSSTNDLSSLFKEYQGVPFLIIDLLSSLILSAISFHTLNVQIISIPLKIILFLALDGWKLLFGTIAESYWVR